MKYKCPKCRNIFDGELTSCPHCGQRFAYRSEEIKIVQPQAIQTNNPSVNKAEENKQIQKAANVVSQTKVVDNRPLTTAPYNNTYMPPNYGYYSNLFVVPSLVEQEEKSRTMNGIFNVFWIILVGLPSCIFSVLYGLSLCVSVVGIPFGITCFKYLRVVFKPAGREVMLNYRYRPFWNTVCLIFGGLSAYLMCLIMSLLFAITIIGYPIARQWFKISKFFLAPFGARVVTINHFTQDYDTRYDLAYMLADIYEDDRLVRLSDGREMLASQAIKETLTPNERLTLIQKLNTKFQFRINRKRRPIFSFLKLADVEVGIFNLIASVILSLLVTLIVISSLSKNILGDRYLWFLVPALSFVWAFIIIYLLLKIINDSIINKAQCSTALVMKMFKERWRGITTYYHNDIPNKLLLFKSVKKLDEPGVKPYQTVHTVNNMLIELLF